MDELRIVRREEGSLVLANELGDEYRLAINDEVAQEVRQALPRAASAAPVRPREIQALLRAGKSRAQVAEETGLEEADVERFEEPVRAEQRYMLDLAHSVPVRTDPSQTGGTDAQEEQHFGQVVSERLIALGNRSSTWRSWRDEEAGWMIGLAFDSRDGEHDAVWSLDHKKRVLSPLTPDATNLSKMGEIGDRLIPKLRAVDAAVDTEEAREREPQTFDPDALLAPTAEIQPIAAPDAANVAAEDALNADAEYERRREIDHLAVNTTEEAGEDLSQTADLLDALRRRRGERSLDLELPIDETGDTQRSQENSGPSPDRRGRTGAAANIWGASGVAGAPEEPQPMPAPPVPQPVDTPGATPGAPAGDSGVERNEPSDETPKESRGAKRGRASIPSWDDILFGTRSDDDPS